MKDAQVVELTPALAAELLASNDVNRPLSRAILTEYTDAIKRGEWKLNGEPIIVSAGGKLLDGQHRCNAVIRAKRSILTYRIDGIEKEAFATIDCGKRRNSSDVLSIGGVKNARVCAAGARAILRIHGVYSGKPTNAQVLDCVRSNPGLVRWADSFAGSRIKGVIPAMITGVLAVAADSHGEKRVEGFWTGVSTGLGLTQNDPAYQYRERYMSRARGTVFSQDYSLAIAIKAVNAHIQRRQIGLLRWGATEGMPELIA